jgi:hypothetical protein
MKNIVILKGNKLQGTHGDIWSMTWVDDVTYAACNDTMGCPDILYHKCTSNNMSYKDALGRNLIITIIKGEPKNCQVYTVNPMEQLGSCTEYVNGLGAWKSSGLVSVDGVLYLMIFRHRYPIDLKKYPWWKAEKPTIIKSKDYGATWSKVSNNPMFDDKFGNASFVQFGKENENAPKGYVYAISAGEGQWVNNSTCILGRVRKENIMDADRWEFYCGIANEKPFWGKLSNSMPVIEKKEKIGCAPEIIYHSYLKKYILMTFSAPYLKKEYNNWKDAEIDHGKKTLFSIFLANELWGPWECTYEGDGTGVCDYNPRIPLMWLQNQDTKRLWLVSGGNPWQYDNAEDHYGFVVSQLKWK